DCDAGDMRCASNKLLGLGAVAILEIEADVVWNARMHRDVTGERLVKADDRGKIFELYLDQVGGIARGLARLRNHHGDFLAREAYLLLYEQRPFGDDNFAAAASG